MYVDVGRSIEFSDNILAKDPRKKIFFKKQLGGFIKFLKTRNKDGITREQLKEDFYEELMQISQVCAATSNLGELYYGYIICLALHNSPTDIQRIYQEIKDETNLEYTDKYSPNNEEAKRQYIANIIVEARKKGINLSYNVVELINNNALKFSEENLKEKNIKLLELIGGFLEKFGCFEIYKNTYDRMIDGVKLPDLCNQFLKYKKISKEDYKKILDAKQSSESEYKKILRDKKIDKNEFETFLTAMSFSHAMKCEISTGDYSKEGAGIKETFDRRFLEQFDLEELVIRSVFWQNRFAKECSNINQVFLLMDEIDLDKECQDISDEQIEKSFKKAKFLDTLCKKMIVFARNMDMTNVDKKDGYCQIPVIDILEDVSEKVFADYRENFDTNLEDDVAYYIPLANIVDNIYVNKNNMVKTLINNFSDYSRIKNWGYIQEKEYVNTAAINKDNIVIGFDIEGCNFPIRVHVRRDLIIEALRASGKESVLPIYEGNEDFVNYEGVFINTSILMPFNKENKAAIKATLKLANSMPEYANRVNLYEHLVFLIDSDKFPEHLCENVAQGKKVIKRRKPKRYINLETSERLIKGKSGYESFNGR